MGALAKRVRKAAPPVGLDLQGLEVLVVGAARTGVAAANFLVRRGAHVTVTDSREAGMLEPYLAELDDSAARELGGHRRETFLGAELIVPSPGVPMNDPLLAEAARRDITVMSEIELAARFLSLPLIAVTGTNGKSTTVKALGEVLGEAGIPARVCGNIGNPLIGELDGLDELKYLVAEISSFQLEWIDTFSPRIAALLNISEDHLDRYRNFEEYVAAKARIFENQSADDYLILNADDALVREAAAGARSRKVWFSRRMTPRFGVHLFRGWIYSRMGRGAGRRVMPVKEMKIVGEHNWENALAVTAAALLAGASASSIRSALGRFRGLPHRTEFVRERGGVAYYDDSKATNVGAAARTVAGFRQPIVLIAGGRDKGGSYAPLASLLKGHARKLVVMGEAAARIAEELAGTTEIVLAGGMEEAVAVASRTARRGDAVVLSPACSSFDSYSDYAQRGRHFQEEVAKL
jgi:UDP-N-acetylmuramoylalanine--D-glutamate ligase